MEWLYWILGILALLIAVVLIAVGAVRSRFTTLSYACEDTYAVVDRFLKKRYDLIPSLVDALQEHAPHETAVVERVIAHRNRSIKASSLMEKCEAEQALSDALGELMGLSEKYQSLRVSAVMMTLRHDLRAVEQDITNAGDVYNRQARLYNEYYDRAVPNVIATLFKRKKMAEFVYRVAIEE